MCFMNEYCYSYAMVRSYLNDPFKLYMSNKKKGFFFIERFLENQSFLSFVPEKVSAPTAASGSSYLYLASHGFR